MNEDQSEIGEELARAQEKASESFAVAPSSFGAGYDMGFVEGMKHILSLQRGASSEGGS